jgi:hypothetical protein
MRIGKAVAAAASGVAAALAKISSVKTSKRLSKAKIEEMAYRRNGESENNGSLAAGSGNQRRSAGKSGVAKWRISNNQWRLSASANGGVKWRHHQ